MSIPIWIDTLILTYMPSWTKKLEKAGVQESLVNVIFVLVYFLSTAFGTGLQRGNEDRMLPYDYLEKSKYSCQRYVILREAGTKYLAVGPDQRRVVVDDTCKLVFVFPASEMRVPIGYKPSITMKPIKPSALSSSAPGKNQSVPAKSPILPAAKP